MGAPSLEERVTLLEAELARLKQHLKAPPPPAAGPWWERRFGAFKDDPLYEDAMRFGREHREAQRRDDDVAG